MKKEIQKFHVGLKAFIVDGDKLLMVHGNHIDPHWELPGGRIDVGEELLPASEILTREIQEEIGSDIIINIGRPIATWSRLLTTLNTYVYLIGFECRYVSGNIQLSDEHTAYQWVTQSESRELTLASGYDHALDQFWKNR